MFVVFLVFDVFVVTLGLDVLSFRFLRFLGLNFFVLLIFELFLFLFEAFDEPWKGDPGNPAGAEKHWGLWNVDRTPKPAAAALTD